MIRVSATVYGAPGMNERVVQDYANAVRDNARAMWGSIDMNMNVDGRNYRVAIQVDVNVANRASSSWERDRADARLGGSSNVIHLNQGNGTQTPDTTQTATSSRFDRPLPDPETGRDDRLSNRLTVPLADTSAASIATAAFTTAGHEFGHLLGLIDRYYWPPGGEPTNAKSWLSNIMGSGSFGGFDGVIDDRNVAAIAQHVIQDSPGVEGPSLQLRMDAIGKAAEELGERVDRASR